ncbi:MAG: hypothetical protein IPH13_05665 [Planctomycetes bacterium]|nr:hypothetical protein [Planctomycetota bacterium]
MTFSILWSLLSSILLPSSQDQGAAPWLTPLARIAVEHAEIPTYDPDTNCAFVAAGRYVVMIHVGGGDDACVMRTIDVVAAAGLPEQVEGEISHVAIDPRGRGFFAATVIPSERSSMPGRVVFVSTRTARVLSAVWVGFQPDACAFSADGTRLVVVNEGEPTILPGTPVAVVDPPGSISVVDLSGIAVGRDLTKLRQRAATTYFVAGPDVDASALRIHPYHARSPGLDLEPESVAICGHRAFVTFQENSALGVFDLDARAWRALVPLAPMARVCDVSDRDSGAHVDAAIEAWPMPDQIAVASVPAQGGGERIVLVVANEGDDRGDVFETASPLADSARIGDLRARGRIAESVPATLDRLKVDAHHGDGDCDGVIERPLALGARSVSILDAQTLELLGDTGSAFEQSMARECPTLFNADAKNGAPKLDARSDDAGPEPEGVRTLRHDGRTYAITTLERPGALALIDLTQPCEPRVLGVACVASDGDFAPEGLTIVAAEDSPTGEPLVIVAYEGSGTVVVHRLTLPRHD